VVGYYELREKIGMNLKRKAHKQQALQAVWGLHRAEEMQAGSWLGRTP